MDTTEKRRANEAEAITVGQLRDRIKDLPDDAKLYGYIGLSSTLHGGELEYKVQAEYDTKANTILKMKTSVTGGGPIR